MFDIGFLEIMVIGVVGLLVIGPERLPEAARTAAMWLGRTRRMYSRFRQEIENEIGADDIRRDLHNEAIMDELKRTQAAINNPMDLGRQDSGQNQSQQSKPQEPPVMTAKPQDAEPQNDKHGGR